MIWEASWQCGAARTSTPGLRCRRCEARAQCSASVDVKFPECASVGNQVKEGKTIGLGLPTISSNPWLVVDDVNGAILESEGDIQYSQQRAPA